MTAGGTPDAVRAVLHRNGKGWCRAFRCERSLSDHVTTACTIGAGASDRTHSGDRLARERVGHTVLLGTIFAYEGERMMATPGAWGPQRRQSARDNAPPAIGREEIDDALRLQHSHAQRPARRQHLHHGGESRRRRASAAADVPPLPGHQLQQRIGPPQRSDGHRRRHQHHQHTTPPWACRPSRARCYANPAATSSSTRAL